MPMFDGKPRLILLAAILLVLMGAAQASLAASVFPEQAFQFGECGPGTDCYEPVSPEEGEYYAITCTNNAIWFWLPLPAASLVTFIPLVQALALADGAELTIPNGLTLTRSGDTLTVSGSNGSRAPEAGAKSFSLNECITRLGGLPEMIPTLPAPSDGADACRSLPTEAEVVACFTALTYDFETCENTFYALDHVEECGIDCTNWFHIMQYPTDCPNIEESSLGILFRMISYCFNPINPVLGVVSLAALSTRRKRR